MRILAALVIFAFWPGDVGLAQGPGEPTVVTSQSGQFLVSGKAPTGTWTEGRVAQLAAAGRVELDAHLAAVSCDRAVAALNRLLQAPSGWTGRVHVSLPGAARSEVKARIVTARFGRGWQYRLELLNPTDDLTFSRALAQVWLQDRANPPGAERSAEIPLWLVHGLAAEALAWNPDLLVRSQTPINRVVQAPDPVHGPRRLLATRPALTFDELSWPTSDSLAGERRELFDASAHLLVHALLSRPDGKACLRRFVADLGRHLNWQIAFLRAFEPGFNNLLAVEKWWAVQVAAFTGRNQWQMWTQAAALEQLEQLLRIPVENRSTAGDLPRKSTLPVQTVVRDWQGERREQALRALLGQLAQVRRNFPPEALPLLDGYSKAIDQFLRQKTSRLSTAFRGQVLTGSSRADATDCLRQLDSLDAACRQRRQELSPR